MIGMVVTEQEAARREALCKADIEGARVAWQNHDTKENRDAYYAALRRDIVEHMRCYGLEPALPT